jgi:SH3/ankyrin repeat-containing protein
MELTPSDKCPALQYLDDVDPGGVADIAGLKKGDFLLEINNEDVSSASHEHVVDLIRKSGDLVQMTVMSLATMATSTMPMSKSTILPGSAEIPLSRQYATLPRKMGNSCGTLGRSAQAPLPPRRDPKTTLSVGRARAKSMVAGLGESRRWNPQFCDWVIAEGGEKEETEDITKSSSAESIHQITPGGTGNSTPVQIRTASIRQRPTSSRITSAELEELFQRQRSDGDPVQHKYNSLMSSSRFQGGSNTLTHPSSPAKSRVYASVAEMKRSKTKSSKVRFSSAFSGSGELHRDFHSTPDLAQEVSMMLSKNHRSQEDLAHLGNRALPPPNHPPPPPPPAVQVVTVEVSRGGQSEYDNLNKEILEENVVSSFRPTTSAKLYASPEDMKTVGYRSKSLPSHSSRPHVRKSHSMRTNYSTFKPAHVSSPTAKNNANPYAQPIRASRSHSTAGLPVLSARVGHFHPETVAGTRERRRKISSSKSASNVVHMSQGNAPPIPEPDYSCSESERESEEEQKDHTMVSRLATVHLQQVENSGNSNTR